MAQSPRHRWMESATTSHSSDGSGNESGNDDSLNNSNSNPTPTITKPSNQITTTSHSAPNPTVSSPSDITSPTSTTTTSPPYWQSSHTRSISHISIESVHPSGITLLDNTADADEEGGGDANGRGKNEACWARSVVIEDYVVVNGSGIGGLGGIGKAIKMGGGTTGGAGGMGIGGGIGAFVVWNVKVDTLEVCSFLSLLPSIFPLFSFLLLILTSLPQFSIS